MNTIVAKLRAWRYTNYPHSIQISKRMTVQLENQMDQQEMNGAILEVQPFEVVSSLWI